MWYRPKVTRIQCSGQMCIRDSFLTCTFGEEKDGKVLEKGTACKMARGQMVRWMAEQGVEQAGDLRDFDGLGYAFSPVHSTEHHFVFLKGET